MSDFLKSLAVLALLGLLLSGWWSIRSPENNQGICDTSPTECADAAESDF